MNLIMMIVLLFVLGTVFGSLGSVLITRFADGINKKILKDFLFGFSHCPQCKHRLHAKNLIPIFSFLAQHGTCEYCHNPIANMYPILEILSGLVFVGTYRVMGDAGGGMVIFWMVMNWLFLLMIVHDFQTYELHVPLWIGALALSLIAQFGGGMGDYGWAFWGSILLGAICVGIYYGAKWYVQKKYNKKMEGFGEGDVMIGFLLGTLFPFIFINNSLVPSFVTLGEMIIVFFILSSVLGLVFFVGKSLAQKHFRLRMHYIPFIPFMLIAFWILLYGGRYFIHLFFGGY